jgi:uncharacterized membrane protein
MLKPSGLTLAAMFVAAAAIAGSASFLLSRYAALPELLPVHFDFRGIPNGWQFKTALRVFLPVLIELALASTLGGIGALLLSRRPGGQDVRATDASAPDVQAALVAAEAVLLIAAIWIAFQGYAAYALVRMWASQFGALGPWYTRLEWIGALLTAIVGVRAHVLLGHPDARPFVAAHWRFGQLYNNRNDPALFVPTRDGTRWTLNFGRHAAVALLGLIVVVGVVAPTIILVLTLR